MSEKSLPYSLERSWSDLLQNELKDHYFKDLMLFVQGEKTAGYDIYPPEELIFNALNSTPYPEVKVVIVGQDPYHGPRQAHGLAFSVPNGEDIPPSLKNIYKELKSDLGVLPPEEGSLLSWAKQGVLLLNTTLTVQKGKPLSHSGKGWERFTDAVIRVLMERSLPPLFVLWGRLAKEKFEKSRWLNMNNIAVFEAAHPSPFSAARGFFGCKHFSKINEYLKGKGESPIIWGV